MYQGVWPLGDAAGSLVVVLRTLGTAAVSLGVVWLTLGANTFICGSIVAVLVSGYRQMVLSSIAYWARSAATSAFAVDILLNILLSFLSPSSVSLPAGMLPLSAMVSCFAAATTCDLGAIAGLVMYLCWK